jgi:hypothetical protein
MKKVSKMRDEYDFKDGIRGKYAKKFAEGTNLVLLEPDVAREFPDSKSVNKALREVMARKSAGSKESRRHR